MDQAEVNPAHVQSRRAQANKGLIVQALQQDSAVRELRHALP